MSTRYDPELDDVLQDQELRRLGELLSMIRPAQPPADDAFRSSLRRQLMQRAWEMSEGRPSLWRRAFAPPGLAWLGAAAGLVLIASIVVFMTQQPNSTFSQLVVNSPIDGSSSVALQQPILVAFNQPMDHAKTQAAVQITPATTVTFSWQQGALGSSAGTGETLAVQPVSGNLAPNTQYQVTIGSGATTASGQPLVNSQTITFVTQPPTPPAPTPSPTARPSSSPGSLLTDERTLAPLGGSVTAPVQWSADSSTVYFVNASGALDAVPLKGGDVKIVVPDGVSSPAIAPAGDRLAYIRAGKLEVLTFASGTTAEVATPSPVTLVGWAKDKVVWSTSDGFWTQGTNGPSGIAPVPAGAAVVSIAPDGAHAVYQQGQQAFVIDLTTQSSAALGPAGARFAGWSPDGTQLLYASANGLAVADLKGATVHVLPPGDASWSSQDAILLGGDTQVYQVRPDGSSQVKLANGTYRSPAWAPNGTSFTFLRGGSLWTASAPAMPPQPTVLEQAATVVNEFLQARQKGQSDQAAAFLDANGKNAYSGTGLNLVFNGDPRFSRFYILTQEITGTQPDTATFVVRLVLTHGKLDVSDVEEKLTLVRDATTGQFAIDDAVAGAHRDLGKGAEVVGVVVTADTVLVTFDSDLDPNTVSSGVQVLNATGKPLDATAVYASRTVTISGLDLKPNAPFKLVVLTSIRDVTGHNVASEYDLPFVGPVVKGHGDHTGSGGAVASTSPSPAATATPASSPNPN